MQGLFFSWPCTDQQKSEFKTPLEVPLGAGILPIGSMGGGVK